jgi:hypothetical protein
MNLSEHFRATRKAVVPKLIEYRTTDPRIVDAVRMLDVAADEIDRLQSAVVTLRKHGDKMAAALNAEAKRTSGRDNAVNGDAQAYEIACLWMDKGEAQTE